MNPSVLESTFLHSVLIFGENGVLWPYATWVRECGLQRPFLLKKQKKNICGLERVFRTSGCFWNALERADRSWERSTFGGSLTWKQTHRYFGPNTQDHENEPLFFHPDGSTTDFHKRESCVYTQATAAHRRHLVLNKLSVKPVAVSTFKASTFDTVCVVQRNRRRRAALWGAEGPGDQQDVRTQRKRRSLRRDLRPPQHHVQHGLHSDPGELQRRLQSADDELHKGDGLSQLF